MPVVAGASCGDCVSSPSAHVARLAQRVGEEPPLARRAQPELEPPVHAVLQVVGGHVLHLAQQLVERLVEVRLRQLLASTSPAPTGRRRRPSARRSSRASAPPAPQRSQITRFGHCGALYRGCAALAIRRMTIRRRWIESALAHMSDRTFYITTPIYYPNGEPHLGHVYTTLCADMLARYHRLRRRRDVLPHRHRRARHQDGQDRRRAEASSRGSWPTRYVDGLPRRLERAGRHQRRLHPHDRATRHKTACRRSSSKLVANGDIYLGGYEGWYDEGQEEFVTETEAKANEFKSAISGKPLVRYKEPTLLLPPEQVRPAACWRTSRQHPEFIQPRVAAQRGDQQAEARASRTCRSAGRR